MSAHRQPSQLVLTVDQYEEGYNGLVRPEATLPADCYITDEAYRRDLQSIWYRQWVYVCRSEELANPRDYTVQRLGDQEIVVLRDDEGVLNAFHNTCRHRGSVLLTETCGTLRSPTITCPYHAWSYSLQGDLKRTPTKFEQTGFTLTDKSLFHVAVRDWRGFIFINLDVEHFPPLEAGMDCQAEAHRNWPLEQLRVGHTFRKQINCNWKIFWENFSECLHCPGVHPELSKRVPLYQRSLMEVQDDPRWQTHSDNGDPRYQPGLAGEAKSWTPDGQAIDETFAELTDQEIAAGHTYETMWPTMFLVGHVDHVRIVRLLPLGAQTTEVQSEWLFRPETLARPGFDPGRIASFAEQVLEQDGHASELNQRGLRSIRYQQGSLMAEEYEVHAFQSWVRDQWARGAAR